MSGLYFTGLGSGIDTDNMVNYLIEIERQPLVQVAAQQKELRAKESCWQEVRSRLDALEQSASELQCSSLYSQKTAAVDREGLVEVAAASTAAAGSYRMEIAALARAHSVASDTVAAITGDGEADSASALGLSGSFLLNGETVAIAEGDSLQDICAQIDGLEEAGVNAVIIDGRLVITRIKTGAAEIAIEDSGLSRELGLLVEQPGSGSYLARTIQEGCEARLTLNGLEVTRSSNVIDDLLEGVTFKLVQAGDKPLTITVADDHRPLLGKMEHFIRQYNSTYQFVKEQIAVDPKTGTRGTLYGESSLNQVLAAIRRTATAVAGEAGVYNSLSTVGIRTARWGSAEPEGTLILDQAKLKEILETDSGAVADLLSSEKGPVGRLGSYLGNLTRKGEGLLHFRSKGIENRIKDLNRRAETLELRLEKREQTLRRQFLAAERVIGQMNSQGQWLEQQLSLMTGSINPGAGSR